MTQQNNEFEKWYVKNITHTDEYVLEILNNTLQELLKRGYELGCEEYLIDSLPNSNQDKKTIDFYGRA